MPCSLITFEIVLRTVPLIYRAAAKVDPKEISTDLDLMKELDSVQSSLSSDRHCAPYGSRGRGALRQGLHLLT
jgi:hypothetical protein